MNEQILFQDQKLTVYVDRIVSGNSIFYYPNIDGVTIYSGKPLLWSGILAIVVLIPIVFVLLWGSKFLGLGLLAPFVVLILPFVGFGAFSFIYKVNCLYVSINGRSVPLLKSKKREIVENAKIAIDVAKNESK